MQQPGNSGALCAQAPVAPVAPVAPLAPVPPPAAPPRPEAGVCALSPAQYFTMLFLCLVPVIGFFAALLWAHGRDRAPARRNLARAFLWLHGAALAVFIVFLCVWVLFLVRQYSLFSLPVI